jgi:hypothetical protein
MFKNKVLRKIFRPTKDEVKLEKILHKNELHDLHWSQIFYKDNEIQEATMG